MLVCKYLQEFFFFLSKIQQNLSRCEFPHEFANHSVNSFALDSQAFHQLVVEVVFCDIFDYYFSSVSLVFSF